MTYILLATFFNAAYHTLQKLAGPLINSFLGTAIVGAAALVLAISFLVKNNNSISWEWSGMGFVILMGIAAFGIDYFALKAFSVGQELSVGGVVIVGGTILLTTLFGLVVLSEGVSFFKIIGILLTFIGCLFLLKS